MRTYRKWVLSLGIMAVAPGMVMGGPFSFLKAKNSRTATKASRAASAESNQQVANKIAQALGAAKLQGKGIKIDFKKGTALLRGQVTDASQKVKASRVAGRVSGVARVENRLTIIDAATPQTASEAPQPLNQKRKSFVQQVGYDEAQLPLPVPPSPAVSAPQDNQKMAEKVAKAISSTPLRDNDIFVRFQNGQVTLTGSVADAKQWEAAGRFVSQVSGVKSVNNRLDIGKANAPQMAQGPQQPLMAPYAGPPVAPAAFHRGMMAAQMAAPAQGMPATPAAYTTPHLPEYAWPSTAAYPNSAQVSYPQQYSASAWPYIGPFYPYPQVPLGWRQAQLEWDDGSWNLNFRSRTDRWWWFMHPKNW